MFSTWISCTFKIFLSIFFIWHFFSIFLRIRILMNKFKKENQTFWDYFHNLVSIYFIVDLALYIFLLLLSLKNLHLIIHVIMKDFINWNLNSCSIVLQNSHFFHFNLNHRNAKALLLFRINSSFRAEKVSFKKFFILFILVIFHLNN